MINSCILNRALKLLETSMSFAAVSKVPAGCARLQLLMLLESETKTC